jgi:hypothetical protein
MLGAARRLSLRTAVAAIVSGLVLVSGARGQDDVLYRIPLAPIAPTMEDCRRLSAEFGELVQQVLGRIQQCMRTTETKIGYGLECSHPRGVVTRLRAWPHCGSDEATLCELYARRDAEVSECQSRVRAGMERRRGAEEHAQALKNANDRYDSFRRAYDSTKSLLTDPRKFLMQTLSREIWSRIFPKGETESLGDRPDLAEEVYRYAFNQAKAGIRLTPSPFIRSIQQQMLDRLGGEFARTLVELDRIERALERFGTSEMDALARTAPVPVRSQPLGGADDCAILEDFQESRSLMQSDQERWLDLVAKCEE